MSVLVFVILGHDFANLEQMVGDEKERKKGSEREQNVHENLRPCTL